MNLLYANDGEWSMVSMAEEVAALWIFQDNDNDSSAFVYYCWKALTNY